MIKKISLIFLSLVIFSGCNLALSYLDSKIDATEPGPTPLPTSGPVIVLDPKIQNGDFETGDKTGWEGEFNVIEPAALNGSYGARLNCPGYITQNIRGLTPDTEYVLSINTRYMNPTGEAEVIIRYCEDEEITVPLSNENTEWDYITISFTPCIESTDTTGVTISITCSRTNMDVDDIVLEEATGLD